MASSYQLYNRLRRPKNKCGDLAFTKILAIAFLGLIFVTALALAIFHIAKQGTTKMESRKSIQPNQMSALLKYFNITDGIQIKWAHAVNSRKELKAALNDDSFRMLEADVILDLAQKEPIMAHPPINTSDITLEHWIQQVLSHKDKGMKLDFKELKVVEPSITILEKTAHNTTLPPVVLNADILVGPNNPKATPLNGTEFIRLCSKYLNDLTLSLGWTTDYTNTAYDGYSWEMVKEMFELVRNVPQTVTFPVRASLVASSRQQLLWLLNQRNDFSLTVWTSKDDIYDVGEIEFLRSHPTRIYYDLPESERHHLYDP